MRDVYVESTWTYGRMYVDYVSISDVARACHEPIHQWKHRSSFLCCMRPTTSVNGEMSTQRWCFVLICLDRDIL